MVRRELYLYDLIEDVYSFTQSPFSEQAYHACQFTGGQNQEWSLAADDVDWERVAGGRKTTPEEMLINLCFRKVRLDNLHDPSGSIWVRKSTKNE